MTQNLVSLSGGKDSTALLLLAIERDTPNLTAVFADTGNEHQITYDYVRYLEHLAVPIKWVKADFTARIAQKREYMLNHWVAKGVPEHIVSRAVEVMQPTGIPFLDLCLWKNRFPSTKARFCSEELKKNPILELVVYPYLDSGHDVESWQGVRADESDSRSKLKEHEYVLSRPFEDVDAELWNYRPILNWTAQDCFDMHKRHGINHNPLYELGMGRVGCMPCIHARKAELLEIVKRFPEEIERIAEWERIVAQISKRQSATFFASNKRGHGIHALIEWAKTARGGQQYGLLESAAPTSCSSIYGLCE